jgi:acyl-CoA thioesterase FadM
MEGWTETYRGMVKAWECDTFGHFTVAYYFDRFAAASAAMRDVLWDHPPTGWRSAEFLARFSAELRSGDALHILSGVVDGGDGFLRLGHKIVNSASGETVTTAEELLRRDAPGAEAPRSSPHAAGWEPSKEREAVIEIENDEGFVDSARDVVQAREADAGDELALPDYVHRTSAASLQLLNAIGMNSAYMREARRGFSTFEILLRLAPPGPRAGDRLAIRSGLLQLGSSSLRMLHRVRDARTGRTVAWLRQSGVHFDLEARRSTPIPAELRGKAAGFVVGAGDRPAEGRRR